jgi:diguanylate cyclase (GGDEF)-like protein/PAS domain S-box-containing protein
MGGRGAEGGGGREPEGRLRCQAREAYKVDPVNGSALYSTPVRRGRKWEECVDPTDHDKKDLGNGPSGGHGPTHANGGPPGGDGWLLSALENSSEVVKVVDAGGILRYASPAFGRIFGHDPGEAAGTMNVLDHVHPDDLPRVLAESERATSAGGTISNKVEYRFRHKDGSWRWVESVGTYLLDDPHVGSVVVSVRDVTRRKEAEERLRFQAKLLGMVGESVIALDVDGLVVYWNRAAEVMYGWSAEEAMGRRLKDMVVPDGLRGQAEEIAAQLREGKDWRGEFKVLRKDGTTFPVEAINSPVFGEDGVLTGVIGVLRDVTERKLVEEALRDAEERFRTLVEQIPAVTYIDPVDDPDTSLYTSPHIERMLGYTPEEWRANKLWKERLHPDDQERILAADERFEASGEPFREEYRLLARDDSVVWVREEAVLVRDEEGEPLYWQGVFYDLTDRKEAERTLRESERRFRSAFDDAAVGMALVGLDGRWLRVNRSLCEMLGYPQGELLGKTFQDVTHPADLEKDLGHLRRLVAGEIRTYQMEKRYLHKEGRVVWAMLSVSLVRDEGGEPLYFVSQVQDMSGRKRMEGQLQRQALHDDLTGLPNRKLLVDRLRQALERTRRRRGRKVAVLFMDLDGFKVVNDSLGHEAGDLLLVIVAERLRRCLRPEDTLARFGGDEFVVLLESVEVPGEAVRVAQRITDELRRPFVLEGRELHVSASAGISSGTARTKTPEDLLRDADTAMYRAKEGGGGFRVFDPAMHERVARRLDLENDLRRAVELGEFVLHYQPVFDFSDQGVWGTEALLRWDHPERGLLGPSEFVAVAEETGLIVPIGNWALAEACRRTKGWQDAHPQNPPLGVIVNLSARQLRHPGCEGAIRAALNESGLPPGSLSLDVTETAFIDALEDNRTALERIRALGVRISIDDFGMGYSSLSYLKRLPADALKIDRSFLKGFGEDARDTALVRMVIDVGHTLGMRVIAEGVEEWAQAALLAETGCDMAQGYHFSEPVPPEQVPGLLGA